MGIVNSELQFDEKLKVFDDPDMNCQIIRKYGCVISMNDCGADIDRIAKGGCQEAWENKEIVDWTKKYFMAKNGDLVTWNHHGLMKLK